MPESRLHTDLVNQLIRWMQTNTAYPARAALLASLPEAGRNCPPAVGGFVPDVFLFDSTSGLAVIGEAKTSSDLESAHTRKQLTGFLTHLRVAKEGVLALAVPWFCINQARSLVVALQYELRSEGVLILIPPQLRG